MKTNSIVFGIALLMGLSLSNSVFSQDTHETSQTLGLSVAGSALLKVTGPAVALSMTGATVAGAAFTAIATDSLTRLKVSSLVDGAVTRSIDAAITLGTLTGTTLSLELINPNDFLPLATNAGSSTKQDLTDGASHPLVTGITTCWSGTGTDDGYIIKYVFAKDPLASAFAGGSVTVSFTITE